METKFKFIKASGGKFVRKFRMQTEIVECEIALIKRRDGYQLVGYTKVGSQEVNSMLCDAVDDKDIGNKLFEYAVMQYTRAAVTKD